MGGARPKRLKTLSESGNGGSIRQGPADANATGAKRRLKRRRRTGADKAQRRGAGEPTAPNAGPESGRSAVADAKAGARSPSGGTGQGKKRRRGRRRGNRPSPDIQQTQKTATASGPDGGEPRSTVGADAARQRQSDQPSRQPLLGPQPGRTTGGRHNGNRERVAVLNEAIAVPVPVADCEAGGRIVPSGKPRAADRPAPGEPRVARTERNARAGNYRGTLYAALDLGTNNCRLLVAKPEGRSFRVVDAYSRIVRLGEGIGASRRLSDAAQERAIEALAVCRDKLAQCGTPVRARLIATEACRAAENGPLFIERVRSETGLALEIVTRETEARLAVAGCTSLVAPEADGVVLFDIGGGSSELVWLDLRNRCGARGLALTRFIRHWTSLPLGVVTLAERHGGTKVGPEDFEAMVEDVSQHLTSFAMGAMLSEAISSGDVHMLGTSGTVTTLAGVHLGLERYDRRRVDGTWLADTDVSAMIDRLLAMPYEERVGNPCIGADRADLVLAGCAILEAIRRRWPCPRLRVADRGLREGILMELMAADRKGRRPYRRH